MIHLGVSAHVSMAWKWHPSCIAGTCIPRNTYVHVTATEKWERGTLHTTVHKYRQGGKQFVFVESSFGRNIKTKYQNIRFFFFYNNISCIWATLVLYRSSTDWSFLKEKIQKICIPWSVHIFLKKVTKFKARTFFLNQRDDVVIIRADFQQGMESVSYSSSRTQWLALLCSSNGNMTLLCRVLFSVTELI